MLGRLGLVRKSYRRKSGGETSSREMVYEGFVYSLIKIGHHVSVTRTQDRVGAAPKREGWGGRLYNPPEAACHTSPTSGHILTHSRKLVGLRCVGCGLRRG